MGGGTMWFLAVALLGVATGLRSMTPMAVVCWFAALGTLPVSGTWASWTGRLAVACVFSVLAVGELIADKLPRVPSRTSPGPLMVRVLLGGLAGAIAATAVHVSGLEGALLGGVGALSGSFAGFVARRDIVRRLGCSDWPVAVVEDVVAVLAAVVALRLTTG